MGTKTSIEKPVSSQTQLAGTLKSIDHYKDVIRKTDLISKDVKHYVQQNYSVMEKYVKLNEKNMAKYKENLSVFSTEEKLDLALDIIFTNFDIINSGMESNRVLIDSLEKGLEKQRNILFLLLKASSQLIGFVFSRLKGR
ncbi:hypothetical protein DID77_02550 [Candidatus Marinamargulisbacteria bacterium SCGC AG-439-L15]|nr:hypothetical protein DID77_02550 [Candidatus Marinamargulisbacteria bacterium SCGC AG-439-L15]